MARDERFSNEFLVALGRITVNFSFLEAVIRNSISILTEAPGIVEMLTARLNFHILLNSLGAVFNSITQDPQQTEGLRNLLTRAGNVGEERNEVVHSVWLTGQDGVIRHRTNVRRRGMQIDFEDTDHSDLDVLADRIAEVAHDIQQFVKNLIV